MTEYISRQEAIDRLQDFCDWCRDGRKQGADFVLDCIIPNLPSADVRENVKGEWVKGNYVHRGCYNYSCSACKELIGTWNGDYMDTHQGWLFCPMCGADMRGDSE